MTFQFIDPSTIRAAAERGDNWYPHAEHFPIPETYTQPAITPRGYMLHTMAGPKTTSPEALYQYMNRADVNGECHQIIGYSRCLQVVPFNVRADNNYKANAWFENGVRYGFVSVETQDDGSNNNVEDDPWTAFQLEHLAGTAAFLHLRYGIPLDRCATWTDGGVDGHRAFPEWSLYAGKTCPGEARWHQIPTVIAIAIQIVNQEEEMNTLTDTLPKPRRVYDSRTMATPFLPGEQRHIYVGDGVTEAFINVTVVSVGDLGGYISINDPGFPPETSVVNYSIEDHVECNAVPALAPNGYILVANTNGYAHVIIDVFAQ